MTNPAAPAATNRVAVADLTPGSLVVSGHGYGEHPAYVASVARFTRSTTLVTFLGGRTRPMRSTDIVDVRPLVVRSAR